MDNKNQTKKLKLRLQWLFFYFIRWIALISPAIFLIWLGRKITKSEVLHDEWWKSWVAVFCFWFAAAYYAQSARRGNKELWRMVQDIPFRGAVAL